MNDVISKFIKGDTKAFDEIYSKYSKAMYAICLRYAKTQDAASDIMQEAFIKIYKNRKKFDPKYPIASWIKRIVVNEAINQYRSELKFVNTEESSFKEHDSPFEVVVDGDDLKRVLMLALKEISQGCRTIFNLYTFENLTHKEIAEHLNISESTSKTQYMKAKRLIKAFLEENKITRAQFVDEKL